MNLLTILVWQEYQTILQKHPSEEAQKQTRSLQMKILLINLAVGEVVVYKNAEKAWGNTGGSQSNNKANLPTSVYTSQDFLVELQKSMKQPQK